jgi:hypothetical protein
MQVGGDEQELLIRETRLAVQLGAGEDSLVDKQTQNLDSRSPGFVYFDGGSYSCCEFDIGMSSTTSIISVELLNRHPFSTQPCPSGHCPCSSEVLPT